MNNKVVFLALIILAVGILTTCHGAVSRRSFLRHCSDEEPRCPDWAARGDCDSNPRWMLIHCEKSCKQCENCIDQDRFCPRWAERGDCRANSHWMLRYCKKSCLRC